MKKVTEDTEEGSMSGPSLIPIGLRNRDRDRSRDNSGSGSGNGSGGGNAWTKAVAIPSSSSSLGLVSSHPGRLIVSAGNDDGKNILHVSGPLAVRGPIEEDWNTAVPVYGVNQGNASSTPPSLSSSSSSSSSATSASDLLHDVYPLPTATSISPTSTSTSSPFFSSFPSSSYQSGSVINYTTQSHSNTLINANTNSDSTSTSNSSTGGQCKPSTIQTSIPSSFSRNNYVNVNPAVLLNRRISNSSINNNVNNNDSSNNQIQPYIQSNGNMSEYRANTVINHTSNSTVYLQNDSIEVPRVDDVTANPPSAEGFLSKYVRDIGLRARSLVGGLLKRDETVQADGDSETVEGDEVRLAGKIHGMLVIEGSKMKS